MSLWYFLRIMPIYEYQCQKCQGVFEILQGFNDKPARKCESCGGKLKRIISLSAFHLKGSGWYETDYGKKKVSEPKQLKDHDSSEAAPAADGDSANGSAATAESPTPSDPSKVYDSIKSDTKKAKGNPKSAAKAK